MKTAARPALGTSLTEQAATASNPFTSYSLPAKTPAALQPPGTVLLLRSAQVYDPAAERRHPSTGDDLTPNARTGAAKPWPLNTGTPVSAGCSAMALQLGEVYTEQQVQTAYGVGTVGGTRLTLGKGTSASPRRCGTTRRTARMPSAAEP